MNTAQLIKYFIGFLFIVNIVKANPPDWQVNPASYQFSANITAILYVNDTLCKGNTNPIAAFVGNEIRGVTNAIAVNDAWYFFLTTYANVAEGETLSFKIYVPEFDAIGAIDETIPFVPNDVIGNPQDPYIFHGYIVNYDRAPEVSNIPDQEIEQAENFQPFDLDDYLIEHNGDNVVWSVSGNGQLNVNIGQNNVVTVTHPPQFTGSVSLIFTATDNTAHQYTDSDTAVFTVRPTDVPPVIGTIPNQTIRIGGSFSSITLENYVSSSDGDEVKWSYYFNESSPDAKPSWNINPTNFQNTMTITAEVISIGKYAVGENNILAAFAGNELRGTANAINAVDKWLYFITVYANEDDEVISFRFYDSIAHLNIPIEEQEIFSSNAALGDPLTPIVFNAGNIVIHIDSNSVASIIKPSKFWIGNETVTFIATDKSTDNHFADSVEVNFTAEYYAFSANPIALDVGKVIPGASISDSIIITNYGELPIGIISAISLSNEFAVTPNSDVTIPSGASKAFQITFTPAGNNQRSGAIIFYHDAASSPDTVIVTGFALGKYRTFRHSINDFSQKAEKLKFKKEVLHSPPNIMTALENVFFRQVSKSEYPKGRTLLGIERSDSAKVYAWITLKKASDVAKGMKGTHDGQAYPLDYFRDAIKNTKKKLAKNIKFETKLNNPAIAQGILFKLNILASDSEITPYGFGSLVLDTNAILAGRNLKGMSLYAIANYYDSAMTFWKKFSIDTTEDYEALRSFVVNILKRINDGFYEPIDTSLKNYSLDTAAITIGTVDTRGKKNPYGVALHGVLAAEEVSIVKQVTDAKNSILFNERNELQSLTRSFMLEQNYPNPFNPTTTIGFSLLAVGNVTLKIYNVLGQEIATLLNNEAMEAGTHEIQFDANRLSSGVYYYRLQAGRFFAVKKMLLLK